MTVPREYSGVLAKPDTHVDTGEADEIVDVSVEAVVSDATEPLEERGNVCSAVLCVLLNKLGRPMCLHL